MSQGRGRNDHQFSQVPRAEIPRSVFSRSHGYKSTFDAGYLIPFLVDEALPGDTFKVNVSMFGRLTTPITPIMDNMYLEWFFFAVPYRLLWDNWQRFCGEQDNPTDSTSYLVPQVPPSGQGFDYQGVFDYMGVPPNVAGTLAVNALFPRAYNLVWHEWFRDQNLQNAPVLNRDDGPDVEGDYPLRKRGKRHDYFTSALPWPQKGAGVSLPLGGTANVVRESASAVPGFESTDAGATIRQLTFQHDQVGAGSPSPVHVAWPGGANDVAGAAIRWGTEVGLMTDLSSATAVTINSLRQAFQIQKLMERDARGGTRYTEIVKAHFGVTSPDARLQRPEFLGGGSTPVQLTPVPQTSATAGGSPQGRLSAFGTFAASKGGFVKSFVEHCVILGLVMVRADLTYQQGLQKMWSRRTKYDHYWPALSHLGEQAILNKEIFVQGTSADEDVFGYQERYAEYRYFPSLLTSQMRSADPNTLEFWHLAQDFAALPTLGDTFIQEDPPIDRVVATPTEPHFILDAYFDVQAARPMPVYSVPGLIDHF